MRLMSNTLVPKLRFPEFRDLPAWREVVLGEVLHEHGTKSDGQSQVHSVSVHKGVVNQIEHLGRSYAANKTDHYGLVKPHDIIYTKSPTGSFPFGIVKQSRLPYPVIVSPLYGVFSPANEHIGYILDAYFESPIRTNNYLDPITQKGAKNTIQISNTTFLSKGLHLPEDRHEQQKIAECLKSLDDLIAAEGRQLEVLRTFKRGLLQYLIPREGETTPRLRFPKFLGQSPQETKLAEVTVESTTRNVARMEGIRVMGVTKAEGIVPMKERIIGAHIARYKVVRQNWFAYNPMRINVGSIARWPGADDILVSPDYIVFRCSGTESSGLDPDYLDHYRRSNTWFKFFNEGGDGSVRVRFYYKDLARLQISLPSLAEQQRIASCLSSLDAMITSKSKGLDTLKLHKQALMQSLFPPAEVAA